MLPPLGVLFTEQVELFYILKLREFLAAEHRLGFVIGADDMVTVEIVD